MMENVFYFMLKTLFVLELFTFSSWLFGYVEIKSSRPECSVKTVFLKISQNSQEDACARVSFLIKLQAWGHNK